MAVMFSIPIINRRLLMPVGSELGFIETHKPCGSCEGTEALCNDCGGHGDVPEVRCPICGSIDIAGDEIASYGGTSEGWDTCNFCGFTSSWANLSAVI